MTNLSNCKICQILAIRNYQSFYKNFTCKKIILLAKILQEILHVKFLLFYNPSIQEFCQPSGMKYLSKHEWQESKGKTCESLTNNICQTKSELIESVNTVLPVQEENL